MNGVGARQFLEIRSEETGFTAVALDHLEKLQRSVPCRIFRFVPTCLATIEQEATDHHFFTVDRQIVDGAVFALRVPPQLIAGCRIEADHCLGDVRVPTESGLPGRVVGVAELGDKPTIGDGNTFDKEIEVLPPEHPSRRRVVRRQLFVAAGGIDDFPVADHAVIASHRIVILTSETDERTKIDGRHLGTAEPIDPLQ